MSVPPGYFDRIADSVNLPLLKKQRVVVVGAGTVGSQIAVELAQCGVGHMRLIDHDVLEISNLVRHALPREYVGRNKAEALAAYLDDQIEGIETEAVPRRIDDTISDGLLDDWLADAALIVSATDDREAQRRIGRRALALSIPAIFPALYGQDGGEVVVQLDPRLPCFYCWDGFRVNREQLRGVVAINATILSVIETAIRLSLGIIDPSSEHRRLIARDPGEPPNQLFVWRPLAALRMLPLPRRPGCPSCGVGPANGRTRPPRREPSASGSNGTRVRDQPRHPPTPLVVVEPNLPSVWTAISVGAAAIAVVLIIVMVTGRGQTNVVQATTSAQELRAARQLKEETAAAVREQKATEAKEQQTAEARISQLSFKCIERYYFGPVNVRRGW